MPRKSITRGILNKLLIAIFLIVSALGIITFYAIYMMYRLGTELNECQALLQSCLH